jgi:ClpX C4-type zinc finger protein
VALTDEDRCSFCGKRRAQVASLVAGQRIAGQTVFICDECVGLLAAEPHVEISPPDPTRAWPPLKLPTRQKAEGPR